MRCLVCDALSRRLRGANHEPAVRVAVASENNTRIRFYVHLLSPKLRVLISEDPGSRRTFTLLGDLEIGVQAGSNT